MDKTATGKFNTAPATPEKPATSATTTAAAPAAAKPAPSPEASLYSRPIPRHLWKYVL